MKRLLVVVVPALAALVLAGTFATAAPGASNPVTNSATGGGHFVLPGGFRSFSFSARKYADGTVKGQAQIYNRNAPNAFAHFELDCLEVNGSFAHISGHVTHTGDPTFWIPGELVRFAVADLGEGNSAPAPDLVTFITPPNEQFRCDDDGAPLPNFHFVERGNVQVR